MVDKHSIDPMMAASRRILVPANWHVQSLQWQRSGLAPMFDLSPATRGCGLALIPFFCTLRNRAPPESNSRHYFLGPKSQQRKTYLIPLCRRLRLHVLNFLLRNVLAPCVRMFLVKTTTVPPTTQAFSFRMKTKGVSYDGVSLRSQQRWLKYY